MAATTGSVRQYDGRARTRRVVPAPRRASRSSSATLETEALTRWATYTRSMLGDPAVAIGAVGAAVGGLGLLLFGRHRRRTRDRRALARTLEDRLAEAMGPGTGTHLERAPTVRRLAVVDADETGGDERPALVPIVRVDLGTTDAPGTRLLFEYVADVLESVHPVLAEREVPVHCYDVEFTFGPGGLLVSGECRRVSVAPALADRLCDDDGYRAVDLRRDVARADRSDETPTTMWSGSRRSDRRWLS